MALQVVVRFEDRPVTYQVISDEKNIYRLLLHESTPGYADGLMPSKINIRRKGKIWVSDLEDDNALVQSLMCELKKLNKD